MEFISEKQNNRKYDTNRFSKLINTGSEVKKNNYWTGNNLQVIRSE